MIDYRILVQAIADWRAGQRPGGREYAEASAGGRPSRPVDVDGHGRRPEYSVGSESPDDDSEYDADIPMDEEIALGEEGEEVQHG